MVLNELIKDGEVERAERDYDELARMLLALREEGSVSFKNWTADTRGPYRSPGYNDFLQAGTIEVTGPGRMAAQLSRPSVTIGQLALGNVANVDMTVLLPELESRIDAADEQDDTKAEAKSGLRRVASTAAEVGTGAAGDLLAAVLKQYGGLP
jgi:hypothetical protein